MTGRQNELALICVHAFAVTAEGKREWREEERERESSIDVEHEPDRVFTVCRSPPNEAETANAYERHVLVHTHRCICIM